MKKKLLILGAMASGFPLVSAQLVLGDKAILSVKEDALVYNGGGLKTIGDGKVIDEGQVMLVGGSMAKFENVGINGAQKNDGGNFILKMTNETLGQLRYGQLYINGLAQGNITGIVDKEFKEYKHGTYQQIALPFYQKKFSDLTSELALMAPVNNQRWSQKEVLVWNNASVRSNYIPATDTSELMGIATPSIAYFMLGAGGGLDVETKHIIKGVPYADNITATLTGAGAGIDFGTDGSNRNYYGEKYNSYLQDAFEQTVWGSDFGKNIYQFGNPFFTNLDVRYLYQQLPRIQGIKLPRANNNKVVTGSDGSTYTSFKEAQYYITYNSSGVPVGDVDKTIILPMQNVVIKMKDNTTSSRILKFDGLRRFLYTSATTAPSLKNPYIKSNTHARRINSFSNGTVKQLGIIAYDKQNNEIARTYYVVYPDAVVGQPKEASTQVSASPAGVLGTYEEAKEGGVDKDLKDKYWLYINEANENTFRGKDIHLEIYDKYIDETETNIDHLGFEIRENADLIADNQSSLTTGESFYVENERRLTRISQGQDFSLADVVSEKGVKSLKLYYGRPSDGQSELSGTGKHSECVVVFDDAIDEYKLLFDKTWKKALVRVLDISGRVVFSRRNVDATEPFIINLPSKEKITYLVTATSETGKQFIQKIVK